MEIFDHEFVVSDEGEVALLIDEIAEEEPGDPVLLICPDRNGAYFHRGPDDIHEIMEINPAIIEKLRSIDTVLVIEMLGEDICHAYDTPTGLYDPPIEDAPVDEPGQ